MKQQCSSCQHFVPPDYIDMRNLQPDDIGECSWEPDGGLPESWRYCPREVMAVQLEDGETCPQWKLKNV